jgi:PAS domain S-box-containing protein
MPASLTPPPDEAPPRPDEGFYRQVVESATDYAIVTVDLDGRVTSWSAGARALLGYEEREILGRDSALLFPPEDREAGVPAARRRRALAEGRAQDERWYLRKDGSRVWGSGLLMTLKAGWGDGHGRGNGEDAPPLGFVKILRDRTERRRADDEQRRLLREVQAERGRLFEVFRQSPAFLAVLREPEHRFELANERYLQLVGDRPLVGRTVREALPEVVDQGFLEILDGVYRTGVPYIGTNVRILLRHGEGRLEERFLDFVYQPFRGPDGAVTGILAHGIDLTDRKRAERRLRASEERYRALFESIDEGFGVIEVLFDASGRAEDYRFVEVNPAFERHTGLHGAVGRRVRELAPDLEPHWFEIYGRVATTGEPVRFVNEARPLNGRWFDVYAFRAGDPARHRVALLFTDITERKRLEADLRHRVAELAEADRRKDEFLAMLAHELRNPLAAVQGAIRVARRPDADPSARDEAHEILDRQAQHLGRLIDDLLDVSRITRGTVELRREPVDVAAVLGRAVEGARPLVDARGHALAIETADGPLRVLADPTRLEQVFGNLLANAAKYTDPGGRIAVVAGRQGDAVVVRVRDNGVGIAPEMLPKVFDLFTQVDQSLARSQGGLGIGLTLVKQLVELHGGTIDAQSEPGRGSAFTVRLPALPAAPEAGHPAPTPADLAGRGRPLLIVDDNADTARLTGRLLAAQGFRVRLVHDGHAALEAARAFAPEVVLLDIGLPGLDGYEVARRLRQDEALKDTLLIAVSGYGDAPSRARGREAGFDHHLVKPIDFDELGRILADAFP